MISRRQFLDMLAAGSLSTGLSMFPVRSIAKPFGERLTIAGIGITGSAIVDGLCETHFSEDVRYIAVLFSSMAGKGHLEVAKVIAESRPDKLCLVGGMGGATASTLLPWLAKTFSRKGISVHAYVTVPYRTGGVRRQRCALDAIETMKSSLDSLYALEQDRILSIDRDITVSEAFQLSREQIRLKLKMIDDGVF